MIIYEGYFNDKESDNDEIIADVEHSSSNHKESLTDYEYLLVIEFKAETEHYFTSSNPLIVRKTKLFVNYLLDNHPFITEHSDNLQYITRYEELATTDIILDTKYSETIFGLKFGINVNTKSPITILKFFRTLFKTVNDKFMKMNGIAVYPKDSAYMHFIDWTTLNYTSLLFKPEMNIVHYQFDALKMGYSIIATFRKDLNAYKRYIAFFNLSHFYNEHLLKQTEYTLRQLSDYTGTKFYKVVKLKKLANKLIGQTINTQVILSKDTDFKFMIDRVKSTSVSIVSSYPEYQQAVANMINSEHITINDIIFKQYDNMRRLMIYIYIGPAYCESRQHVVESAIYLGEDKEDDYSDEIAQQLSDLVFNKVSVTEIKEAFDKSLKPSEAL